MLELADSAGSRAGVPCKRTKSDWAPFQTGLSVPEMLALEVEVEHPQWLLGTLDSAAACADTYHPAQTWRRVEIDGGYRAQSATSLRLVASMIALIRA